MDTEHHHSGQPLQNPEVSYERTDLSVRGIIIFLVGVAVAGLFVHALIGGVFAVMKGVAVRFDAEPNPMVSAQKLPPAPPLQNAGPQSVESFPEPRLQADDAADMNKFLLAQEQQLYPTHPYRTADGTVHISIEDAKRLIVQRGLPVRQAAPATNTAAAPATSGKSASPSAP